MLFKDHLKIVTDAGAVLHLGWDYDIPYFLDPLNGIDVDLKTAQGVNQVGDTVEGQSVSGVSRTLDVVFWGAYALDNARVFSKKLPYFTKGTLYFGDHYFTRFVLQKTPYFSSYTPQPRCSLMLYSEKPFWYSITATAAVLGGYEPAFRGSPPRMRGKVQRAKRSSPTKGITPAYAGKRKRRQSVHCRGQDHPRVCGEKSFGLVAGQVELGSPPRMRGKATLLESPAAVLGITPAYAGKSSASFSF